MKNIVLLLVVITLSSCTKRNVVQNISRSNNYDIIYDTLIIKGVPHEFILSKMYAGYNIIHSPECPCLKNKED